MGHEIVYCSKCQTRLLNADFGRGAAFRIDGIASCDKCSADVLKLLPPDKIQEFLRQIAQAKKGALPPEKPRAKPENRNNTTSIRIVPVAPKTGRALARKKGLGAGAWIGLGAGVAALIGLIVMAGQSSSRPDPAPEIAPEVARQKLASAVAADLANLDQRVKETADKKDLGLALTLIQDSRARHGTPEWNGFVNRKYKELRDAAFRHCEDLKEKALEAQRKGSEGEVKALREQVVKLGVPELLSAFDRAITAKTPKPDEPPAPPKPAGEPGKSPTARFVRIENSYPVLSLAEVQVFSGAENVALKGKASQISTSFEGEAGRAIDGNTDGNWGANSVTHTGGEEPATWWEVDLGRMVRIDRVVVWNRTDGSLGCRLKDYSVLLLDEARKLVDSRKSNDVPNPSTEHVFGSVAAPR